MTFARLQSIPVSRGSIRIPLVGTWEASLTVTADDARDLTGRVLLDLGGQTWSGTVLRAEADLGGLVTVRVVGGAGGLATVLEPKAYRNATRRVLLTDALEVGGESISSASNAAWLAVSVDRWTRPRQTVGELVRAVLDGTGYSWRIAADGAALFVAETWPEVAPQSTIESEDPTRDELVVALEGLDVLPGVTFAGRRVSSATYEFDSAKLRALLSYDEGGRDGAASEIAKFIKREMGSVNLLRPLTGRVLSQAADGTLDVRVFDSDMPDLQRVPVRFGVAGLSVNRVIAGTECYVVHENGDARKPYVVGFAPGSAVSVEVDAGEAKICGSESLALAAPLEVWAAQVQAMSTGLAAWAAAVVLQNPTIPALVGAPISPLVGVATTKIKGA